MREPPLRVLQMENDPGDVHRVEVLLEEMGSPFDLESVETLADGLNRIGESPPDALLLDLSLPDSQGLETYRQVREEAPEIPVVVVTDRDDEEAALEAAKEGVQEYLVKDRFEGTDLVRAVRHAVERHRLVVSFREQTATLRESQEHLERIVEASPDGMLVLDARGRVRFANTAAIRLFGRTVEELRGSDLGLPLAGDPTTEVDLVSSEGEIRVTEMWRVDIEWHGEPAHLVTFHDITQRKRAEQAVRTRGRQQAVVARFGQRAAGTRELDPLFEAATEAVTSTLGSDLTAVLECGDDRSRLTLRAGEGWDPPGSGEETEVELEEGAALTFALRSDSPIVFPSFEEEDRFRRCPLLVDHGVVAGMVAPLVGTEGVWGLLGAFERRPRSFSRDDRVFLESVANILSSTIQRQWAEEVLRERERELERRTWELTERVKELRCLYDIASLLHREDTPLETRLQAVMERISEGWQYPEITEARLELEGREYMTGGFRTTRWKQGREVVIQGEQAGTLEVVYLEERPEADDGPFLAEESMLLVNIVEQIREVLERRRTETALSRSEERLQQILAHSPAVVYSAGLDPEYPASYVSDNASRILGYSSEELLGDPEFWISHVHPEDRDRVEEATDRLREEGRATLEYRFRRSEGEAIWLRDEMTLVRDGAGEPMEVVGVCRNVTEQRELEEQLRQSQKMEAVGRLAGGVAHDFNNLLTAITGYGELVLMEMGPDHPSRPDLEEILKAGERASALTRQLLAFSRRQVLQPKVLDLNHVVSDMEKMLHRVIGEDVELVVEPIPGIHWVEADPGQLEQVLLNLAVNARDAMPRGGTLTVRTDEVAGDEVEAPDAEEAPERWVRLRVRDTGEGMAPEVQERIFEPFFTTKKQGEGTGLGMATVYGIVQQSGGRIEVQSEPGEGTEITVLFPGVEKPPEPRGEQRMTSLEAGNRERILVVEDDEGVRKLVRRTLESRGYEVVVASDGKTALGVCLAEDCVDLVLSDVVMPDMRGPELVAELEARGVELPFLFMSGYPGRERTGPLPSEMRFLQKPFTAEDLLREVQRILKQDRKEA